MGRKPRVHSITKINRGLRILFVLSVVAFLIVFNTVPKSDCEACKFEYGTQKMDYVEAMDLFEKGCLENWRGDKPKEYVYIDIDDLEAVETIDGITNITLKRTQVIP